MPTPTYTENFIDKFIISKITKAQFDELSSAGSLNDNELYIVEDEQLDAGSQTIVNVDTPVSNTDAANKGYVDTTVGGLSSALAIDIDDLSSLVSTKADTSTVNGLASTMSSGMSSLAGAIGTKADSSTVSALASAVSSLDSTVSDKADTSALNNLSSTFSTQIQNVSNDVGSLVSSLSAYALLDSPSFSGIPTAPTASSGASGSQIATTEFVQQAVSAVDVSSQIAGKFNSDGVADVFSESSTYSEGAIVVYEGERYKCIAAVESEGAWTGDSNWSAETIQETIESIDVSSQIAGKLDAVAAADAFSESSTYAIDDVVTHDGLRYKCTTAVTVEGPWDETCWTLETIQEAIDNIDVSDQIAGKLNQTAAAPEFASTSTYFANEYVTYDGTLYRCVQAKTAASAVTPDNDIYNPSTSSAAHWEVVDMTTPDATLDITAAGDLRVVGTDGSILWMQCYDLLSSSSSASGATITLNNEAVRGYLFAKNSTDKMTLVLPTAPSGKVGDLILDVTNPAIGDEFSESSTYASGTQAFYNGDLYTCTTAVETAGSWTGNTNWTLLYSAFNSSSSYASGNIVTYDNAVWKCVVAVETAGDWTGKDNWQTASFIIQQQSNETVSIVVPAGDDLGDMLTFAPGTMCELYFTQTTFNVNTKPTWKIVRQDMQNGGAA